jgi:hypothetical protein
MKLLYVIAQVDLHIVASEALPENSFTLPNLPSHLHLLLLPCLPLGLLLGLLPPPLLYCLPCKHLHLLVQILDFYGLWGGGVRSQYLAIVHQFLTVPSVRTVTFLTFLRYLLCHLVMYRVAVACALGELAWQGLTV